MGTAHMHSMLQEMHTQMFVEELHLCGMSPHALPGCRDVYALWFPQGDAFMWPVR